MMGVPAIHDDGNGADFQWKPQRRQRNRLHKARKENGSALLSGTEPAVNFSSQFPADDAGLTRRARVHRNQKPYMAGRPSYSPNSEQPAISLTDRPLVSPSIYSLETMDLELQNLRRTRAKTPCFWVGQLEEKANDPAAVLAGEYRAELPARTRSPYNPIGPKTLARTVRKVKGQQSLRDALKDDRPDCSDAETLIGSETPKSEASPTSAKFPSRLSHDFPESIERESSPDQQFEEHNAIGLRICLEMLTNELATALFKQHPAEKLDRASGLQIMLMIEAYESVQQRIRQDVHHLHLENENPRHVMAAEQMLDHWIDALYALHDQSEAKKAQDLDEILISHRPSFSKARHQSSPLGSPDMFFDCDDFEESLPTYSRFH